MLKRQKKIGFFAVHSSYQAKNIFIASAVGATKIQHGLCAIEVFTKNQVYHSTNRIGAIYRRRPVTQNFNPVNNRIGEIG